MVRGVARHGSVERHDVRVAQVLQHPHLLLEVAQLVRLEDLDGVLGALVPTLAHGALRPGSELRVGAEGELAPRHLHPGLILLQELQAPAHGP